MLRLVENDSADAEGSTSLGEQSTLDLYPRLRRLQSGARAKPGCRSSGGISRDRRVSPGALEPETTKTPEIKPLDIITMHSRKTNALQINFSAAC
jgi:hypothetical protein